MAKISIILYFFVIKIYVIRAGHLWHSYKFDAGHHRAREELVITNVTSDEQFKFDFLVEKWKGQKILDRFYISGVILEENRNKLGVASIFLNEENNFKVANSEILSFTNEISDFKIFDYWNGTIRQSVPILVVATNKPELIWYQIKDFNFVEFWLWPLVRNLTHFNIFEIDHTPQILLINDYPNGPSADLYEFDLKMPNFWLRQSLKLSDPAKSSAISQFNQDYFISIPQKSLKSLLVYKSSNLMKFVPFRNLTSYAIDEVTSFEIGFKSFIAFNGVNAGIYKFTKSGLILEDVIDSHLNGVNTWVQFDFSDDFILLAQRNLVHGLHEAYVVEVLVYNGAKFEEHEDISCNYFGEFSTDLSCLEEDPLGISGAIGISLEGRNALLVPRKTGNSELFIFNSTIKKKPNPVEIEIKLLKERMTYLDNLVKDQEKTVEDMKNNETEFEHSEKSRDATENEITSLVDDLQIEVHFINDEIDNLNSTMEKIQKFENRSNYHQIIFKGPVEIEGDSNFDIIQSDQINEEPTELTLTDIVTKNRLDKIPSHKVFKDLNAKNLEFDEINDMSARDLIFKSDDNSDLVIDGDMKVKKPLAVLGDLKTSKMNSVNFSSLDNIHNDLKFESIQVLGDLVIEKLNKIKLGEPNKFKSELHEDLNLELDSLVIPKNIQVGTINSLVFDDFLKTVCMKNVETFIPGLVEISEDISVGFGSIEQLNDLKFPSDFVFSDESGAVISGRKVFENTLEVSEAYCEELFDGIKIKEMVTLKTDQNLTGRFIFKDLEVSEKLDIRGKVTGEHATKFLPNPSILETKTIRSKINFKNLEVEGSIILSERFNGRNFEKILDDLIYQNDEEVEITSSKQFLEGFSTRRMQIQTNSINNFSLDSIITKNSDQFLNLTLINGDTTFKNLIIGGSYNEVNVTEVDQNLVKLTGEQYISSTLIFNDFEDLQLDKDLVIVKTLNDLKPENYLYENQLIQIVNNSMELDKISAQNIEVLGDFKGDIENFNIDNFKRQRMSFTEDQEISSEFIFNRSKVDTMKATGTINKMISGELTDEDILLRSIVDNLIVGKYKIGELQVDGSVKIGEINEDDAINLGGVLNHNGFKNYNLKNITFEDLIHFEKPVSIENLSGVGFNDYLKTIIYKNSTNPCFKSPKIFQNGLRIHKYIETKKLNDIILKNILTKYGKQEIRGPIHVDGDVSFENLNLSGNINEMSMNLIKNNYKFENDSKLEIKGDMIFERLVHIFELEVNKDNNTIQNILDSIIYKNEDFNSSGVTTFENNVEMKGNLRVLNQVNGLQLTQFASDIVMTSKDTTINSPLTFTESVKIRENFNIDGNFETEEFSNGVNLDNWKENAIFIDRGILRGDFTFAHGVIVENLNTQFLNNINMSNLINLRSKENLPHLEFEEVHSLNGIPVGNLVNNFNLPEEFSNTFLRNVDQTISSEIIFNQRQILKRSLEIAGKLNGKSVDKIVTTSTDQNLSAIYNFNSKISMDRGLLITTGFVNGINLTLWDQEAVKLWKPQEQQIGHFWSGPENSITFQDKVDGNVLINGMDLGTFRDVLEVKRDFKYRMERNYIDNYNRICKDLNYMHDQIKNQIYKFNYLENLQLLTFGKHVHYSYNFQYKNNNFLLVNEENSCTSHILVWIKTQFQPFKDYDLGQISQIITTTVDDSLLFIIKNGKSECEISESTHVWSFDGKIFKILLKIDDLDFLQESLIPGTFYSIQQGEVAEFHLNPHLEPVVRKYRKWAINEENMAFVPRGLSTGLAISTGTYLIKLQRTEPEFDPSSLNYETEAVILGNFTKELNFHLPGFDKIQNSVIMTVGTQGSKRKLLALASFEETSIKGSLDFIKIYENAVGGKLFQKLPAYKPSTLISLNFENGETLLAFLEDSCQLQVYEYKGIEGFQQRLTFKLEGRKLFEMSLPLFPYQNDRKVIGIVDRNRIGFLEAMMLGNQVDDDDLRCIL